MPTITVQYRYSMSSDRVLDRDATWTGPVRGRSLATVMSELRSRHGTATNIAIIGIAWHDDEDGGAPDASDHTDAEAAEAPPRIMARRPGSAEERGRSARATGGRRGGWSSPTSGRHPR